MLKHCTKTRDRQPGLFCDVCGTRIQNAAMAMAVIPLNNDLQPEASAYHIHKGPCLDAAERAFEYRVGTEELITWLGNVLRESGIRTFPKREYTQPRGKRRHYRIRPRRTVIFDKQPEIKPVRKGSRA